MKKLLLAAFVLLVIASCKKNENNGTTNGTVYGTYSSMDTIYQMLSVKSKTVTMDANTGGSFYGNSGTRYIIPANCLQDASGNTVTGNIQLEAAEYLQVGDMMFSRVLPMSDGQPLISGGEIYINAKQAGQQIFLKPGCSYTANIPRNGDTVSGMEFFVGRPGSDTSQNKVNWIRVVDSLGMVRLYVDPHNHMYDTLQVIPDSFNWCNADRGILSWSPESRIKITLEVNSTAVSEMYEPKIFGVFDHYKSLFLCAASGNEMPKVPIHLAAYVLIKNKFYAGVLAITPASDQTYHITMTEVDPTAFKGQINSLSR